MPNAKTPNIYIYISTQNTIKRGRQRELSIILGRAVGGAGTASTRSEQKSKPCPSAQPVTLDAVCLFQSQSPPPLPPHIDRQADGWMDGSVGSTKLGGRPWPGTVGEMHPTGRRVLQLPGKERKNPTSVANWRLAHAGGKQLQSAAQPREGQMAPSPSSGRAIHHRPTNPTLPATREFAYSGRQQRQHHGCWHS